MQKGREEKSSPVAVVAIVVVVVVATGTTLIKHLYEKQEKHREWKRKIFPEQIDPAPSLSLVAQRAYLNFIPLPLTFS